MATTTRREWLHRAGVSARAPFARAQGASAGRGRVAPRDELVNTLEFEAEAAKGLPAETAALIAGSDRAAFDRITFRPRMMIPCLDLDLSVELFGARLFAPIVVGPLADQRRFHPDAEAATLKGAGLAKAAMVVSARSSTPMATLAGARGETTLFYQVFAEDDAARTRDGAQAAAASGCRALLVTVGPTDTTGREARRIDWTAVDRIAGATSLPVVVKGVASADTARSAKAHGARGVVVSTYGRSESAAQPAALDLIAPVVEAVGPGVPVLADGGFRRGTDVMKALASGATAVLVARPVAWGLAAYGAEGVQSVLELLQTELARVMACCGTPTLADIAPVHITRHRTT